MKSLKIALLVPGCAALLLAAVKHETDSEAWWKHVEFLASDELKGRNTGTPEHRKAAEYVAKEFENAGLKPGGTEGFLQPVQLVSKTLDETKSSLDLVRDGKTEPLKLGTDAYLSSRVDLAPKLEAAVVFVGYGLRIPEAKMDDFAGLDVKGKLVMTIGGAPAGVPAPLLAHYQSSAERSKLLRSLGAVGAVSVPNPHKGDLPWARAALLRTVPAMILANPAMDENQASRMSISVNPDQAEKWFAGSGHTFQELLALEDAHKTIPKFPLKVRIRATPSVKKDPVNSQNVVGVLPGSDPKLKNEYIVLSGHLDHLGVGPAINGDTIYNGAMDNASGIATLIEVAKKLPSFKPKRSVIFLAVTGEEKGLLGSKYFAASPSVGKGAIVANLNFDMFLPIVAPKAMIAYGIDESDLGDRLRLIAQKHSIQLLPDPHPDRNIFIRSDQYNFIKQGVPALSFKLAALPGSPGDQIMETWMKQRYHAPSDDAKQPVNLEAASVFNDMMLALTRDVANSAARPAWKKQSFFTRFAK